MVYQDAQADHERSVTPLEITILGTGTSQGIPVIGCSCKTCSSQDPRDKRMRSAAFIQAGDTGIVIDLGPDFRRQMIDNGISDVHAVLLTHEHNDHISGLDDLRPINFLHKREIPIYGSGRSLLEIKRRFIYAFDPDYYYPGKPKVSSMIINDDSFSVNEVTVQPIPIDHGDMPIYGFRIDDLAYITDAKRIPESSMALLQDLDVLVLNALRFEPHEMHLNISEAVALAGKIKARRTFFTHISHDAGLHAEVDSILPDGIRLAYDGLKLRLA